MDVLVPSPATLKRYGLTADEWLAILRAQGGVCAICKRVPASGRLHTEHEHVKGWKHLPPDQRKLYVRGICCFVCNTQYLGRGLTIDKARAVLAYLEAYGARRPISGVSGWLPIRREQLCER